MDTPSATPGSVVHPGTTGPPSDAGGPSRALPRASWAARSGSWVARPSAERTWWLLLGGILVLAAILRFDALPTRGTWDADQGHDMLTLMAFVRDGVFPLVGPPTSIGDFHHGAAYYYLLAPSAWLGGGDPAVVVGEIAVLGILAVGLVASLARAVGGVAAGVTAGFLMAVSATAIDESTFIWNPNLVAFTSALAVTAGWRAWTTRRARWWLLAAAAQAATMQCHVLGFVLLPPLVVWLVADTRRRSGTERRAVLAVALGAIAIIAVSYVPLLASELQTNFHESREALAFLAGGGQAVAPGPLLRMTFVTMRVLAWPVTGLLIDSLPVGVPAAVAVASLAVWRARVAGGPERDLARWLAATMAWSCVVLGVAIAGLANVTALPVDHYHAFLDPLVFLVVGLGFGSLARLGAPAVPRFVAGRALTVGGVAVVALMVALTAWNVVRMPPFTALDGGYPAAERTARRIVTALGGRTGLIASLPDFKSAEAYLYPVRHLGGNLHLEVPGTIGLGAYVVVCDDLFVTDCGGPAEDRSVAALAEPLRLFDRFIAAPGRTISVYVASAPVVLTGGR